MVRARLAHLGLAALLASCAPQSKSPPTAPPPSADAGFAAPVVDACAGVPDDVPATQLSRLSPSQFSHSLEDLAGHPLPGVTLPAPSGEVISELEVVALGDAAAKTVAAGAHLRFVPCDPDTTDDRACAEGFVRAFGQRLFRHPVDDDESGTLIARYDALRSDPEITPPLSFHEAIDALATVMLQSPQFAYVHEDGVEDPSLPSGVRRTTGFERATTLSLFLLDRAPDDALLDRAAAGDLDTDDGLRAAADQLLDDPRSHAVARRFASSWLGLDASNKGAALENQLKSADAYPYDSPALRAAMRDEVESLYEQAVFGEDHRFRSLLFSPAAKVTGELAQVYGLTRHLGPGISAEWTNLDPAKRPGILTRAAFLAQFAGLTSTSPIRRGVQVYRNVLCLPLGDPPSTSNLTPPAPGTDGALSTRQATELRTAAPACQGCHRLINPVGFALENFGAMGEWRSDERVPTDQGVTTVPIDASTALMIPGMEGTVSGPFDLVQRIADSGLAQKCHAQKWFERAVQRPLSTEDVCTLNRIQQRFAQTDDLRALLLDVATSAPTRLLRPEVEQ